MRKKKKITFSAKKKTPQKVEISFFAIPSNKKVKFTAVKKKPKKVNVKFYRSKSK